MTPNKELNSLSIQLETLIKLTAAQLIDGKTFVEQVRLLNKVGLTPKQIADLTGKTANNVSVTLNNLKKKNKS